MQAQESFAANLAKAICLGSASGRSASRGSGERNASLYDAKHAFVWEKAKGAVELLAAKSGKRILDLGCGTEHRRQESRHVAPCSSEPLSSKTASVGLATRIVTFGSSFLERVPEEQRTAFLRAAEHAARTSLWKGDH